MLTSVAAVTVSVVEPAISETGMVAVIVAVPTPAPFATPSLPEAFEMVAIEPDDVDQLTVFVRSCVLPSVYVPVAVKPWVVPFAMLGVPGVTAMLTSVAAVTVSVVEPAISETGMVAVIVAVPTPAPFATPSLPAALETVAIEPDDVDQLTVFVRSCVLPSVYVPVAVKRWVVPFAMLGVPGVTATLTSVAAVTVSVVEPAIKETGTVAVIVAVPTPSPLATPSLPEALETVAIEPDDVDQLTVFVRSCVLPSV
jgi:hypothetical protein